LEKINIFLYSILDNNNNNKKTLISKSSNYDLYI
jgi:hypothetical protein